MAMAGMDRGQFPGLATMQNLLNTTNLVWTGYYLTPAPSQGNNLGWMGNRAALVTMGWGLAPLYVGQQDPAAGSGNSNTLTAAQGTTDAQDAINMMTQEGFPAGSVVYLDIEQGGQLSQANLDYAGAWIQGVFSLGFTAGVYCSHSQTANQIRGLDNRVILWCFNLSSFNCNQNSTSPFPIPAPAGCGVADASLWQLLQNCSNITDANGNNVLSGVDLDVAIAADPSRIATPPSLTVPAVMGINPNQGSGSGGTSVTITGSGFTAATAVNFGTQAASNFTVNSDTQITATSPAANLSGATDVTVIAPAGTSAISAADQFTYLTPVPSVTAINPNQGPASGGTSVVISGNSFTGATSVSFGPTAASSFNIDNDSQITAISPAANLSGAIDVTVTNPNGTSPTSPADQFTFLTPVPVVTGINPNQGPAAGGTSVIITGSGFTGATAVNFGSQAASNFNVDRDTQITATSPAANISGAIDVTIVTPVGTSAIGAVDQFTYLTPTLLPTVTAINPNQGPVGGGTSVVITGSSFTGTTVVNFGSSAASSFNVDSDTQITAVSPAANLGGAVDITVTNASGSSSTSPADQFTFM